MSCGLPLTRHMVAGLTVVSIASLPTLATAQAAPRVKLYEFGEQLIDGQLKAPSVSQFTGREKVRFERLLSLRKSFLRPLLESSKAPVFK